VDDKVSWSAAIEEVAIQEMEAWKAARFEFASVFAQRIAQRVIAEDAEEMRATSAEGAERG
jgi:hypothetical protein